MFRFARPHNAYWLGQDTPHRSVLMRKNTKIVLKRLLYITLEVVKDRKYVIVHAVECIIATLAKSVFKIAFTFLN